MSRIRIKNFGPIKEGLIENDGWIDVKKVTVFIGNQGSGKSTVAKLISTFTWIEKATNRGDINLNELTPYTFLKFFTFQGIENYFLPDTEIEYEGDRYFINYRKKGNKLIFVEGKNTSYIVPKLMYIPAERNFLSTIKDAFNVKGLPEHLFTFAEELRKAQKQSNGRSIELPIKNYSYEYDEQTESSFLYNKNHRINLMQASSGFQSLIPLFLVTRYLINLIEKSKESPRESMSVNQSIRMSEEITNITLNSSLSINEKQQQLNKVKSKYINRCLFSIIEEPEQNLFPSSQRLILNSILAFNKRPSTNKLIITTHSPYIINYLTLAVQAHSLKNKLKYESVNDPVSLLSRLNGIVPTTATIKQEDLVIYEMNDLNGSITKLGNFEGIPSDKNYLNQSLRRGNEMFDSLLAIEQEL